ncbi:uncharacterized protein LOC136085503 [Hydra vulgaris]|uniref:Uncharacterized protein LOC136085503 n=1 Tax=Hydra vulgaris TaxID=6087 RepID=A0ABM4CM53_HYDVU
MWVFNIVHLVCYWFGINYTVQGFFKQIACMGENTIFDVNDLNLASFLRKSKVTWTKDGRHLYSRRQTHIDANGSLILFNVNLFDSGIYNLTLQSSEYTKTFLFELIVPDTSVELLTEQTIYVKEGNYISMEIKTNDYGSSKWSFVNKLNEKKTLDLVNTNDTPKKKIFKIKNVSLNDEGRYQFLYEVNRCTSVIDIDVVVFNGQFYDFWKCLRSRYHHNFILLLSLLLLGYWIQRREIGVREYAKEYEDELKNRKIKINS